MSIANKLVSAISQIAASNAIVRLLSIATMPILTRLLVPEAYGVAALASTTISLLTTLSITGMGMTYARTFHYTKPPGGKAIEKFVWRYIVVNAISAACLCMIAWELVISDYYSLQRYLGIVVGTGILLNVIKNIAEVRARLNNLYSKLSFSILISGFISASISIAIALWWRQDELALILAVLGGSLTSILILRTPNLRVLLAPLEITRSERLQLLKIGLPAIITAPAYWVLSSVDFWLLNYLEDANSVGIYSVGCSIGLMGMMINKAIHSVWLPEVSRLYESSVPNVRDQLARLIEPLVSMLCIVWLAVTSAGGDMVRLLAAPRFHDAADIIPYISAGVFFYGVLHIANAILLLKKKLHHAIPWWFLGALLSLGLNYFLIQNYGRLGASYTQAITFAFVSIGIVSSAQRLFPLKLRWGRIFLIMTTFAASGIIMHPPWSSSSMMSLLLKLPIGIIISSTLFILANPDVVKKVMHRISGTPSV